MKKHPEIEIEGIENVEAIGNGAEVDEDGEELKPALLCDECKEIRF